MSRDEYLHNVEEGFIKDTIKKGWEKVKSFFKIGIKKIKNFITVFDNKGHVLPVITPQAIVDKFSGSDVVKVYASKSLNDSVVEAGGNKGDENPTYEDNGEIYNYGPDGKEYWKWLKEKKYKNDVEYQNFLAIPSLVKESNHTDADTEKVFENNENNIDESWKGQVGARAKYVDTTGDFRQIRVIGNEEFEKLLNRKLQDWSVRRGKSRIRETDQKVATPLGNILIFGALGIGKSTIPNSVIRKFNEGKDENDMASIISINCANLAEGDFMMPTMPKEINVVDELSNFAKAFPEASSALDGLSQKDKEKIAYTINQSGQFKATDAPKTWLPSYKKTGNEFIDKLLNDAANGGVYTDKDGVGKKVGGGGLIIFDEFLRCREGVFGQLMNFLNDRMLNGWVLGDRWTIIACSNRPVDDDEVKENWDSWTPAARDRWAKMYQLKPDPEAWKAWAKTKGVDQLILDFIFEESSMEKGEYPRWHTSVSHGGPDSGQSKPISPRAWDRVIEEICTYEVDNDLTDLSEIDPDELENIIGGSFPEDFVAEIINWMRDHIDKIDLDAIMEDPKSVYLPKKYVNDPAKAEVLVRILLQECVTKFKKDPDSCTDEQLANIIVWLGTNYKGSMVSVHSFMEGLVNDVFKNKTSHCISKYTKTLMTLMAAYPERDMEKVCASLEAAKQYPYPKGSVEIIKGIMKEYFPWRLKGDKIKYYDDLDLDDEDTKKKVENSPSDTE